MPTTGAVTKRVFSGVALHPFQAAAGTLRRTARLVQYAAGGGTGLETHNVLAEGPDVHRQSEMSSQDDYGEGPSQRDVPAQAIRTDKAPPPVGPYPHARRVGDFLFLSGIGPRKPGTGEIPGITKASW